MRTVLVTLLAAALFVEVIYNIPLFGLLFLPLIPFLFLKCRRTPWFSQVIVLLRALCV